MMIEMPNPYFYLPEGTVSLIPVGKKTYFCLKNFFHSFFDFFTLSLSLLCYSFIASLEFKGSDGQS
jgi:hypothetical protein